MTKLNILHLHQKSGLLSPLHSDTIMGHFCWRMKERLGAEKLDEFCARSAESPVFTVSDGLGVYDGKLFFPKPDYVSEYKPSPEKKKDKVKQFLAVKDRKALKYIDAEGLNLFLQGNISGYEERLLVLENETMPKFTHGLRVSVTIDREQMKATDGGLYSYSPVYPEYSPDKKGGKTSQAVLVRIYNKKHFDEISAGEILKEVFETGFGKKKSAGYGAFGCSELKEFTELKEPEKGNAFLSLGHYTPAPGDGVTKGYYSHTVKYGMLGEERANDRNPFKKPVISFRPGGVFTVKEQKNWYGLVSPESVFGRSDIWHFGAPLTLNAIVND